MLLLLAFRGVAYCSRGKWLLLLALLLALIARVLMLALLLALWVVAAIPLLLLALLLAWSRRACPYTRSLLARFTPKPPPGGSH